MQSGGQTNQSPFSSPSREKSDTMFKKLNKLANTKLRSYVGGKQLINLDIQTHSTSTTQILTKNTTVNHTFTARERYLNSINRKPMERDVLNSSITNNEVLRRHQPIINIRSKMVEGSNKVINQIRKERKATLKLQEEEKRKAIAEMQNQVVKRNTRMIREELFLSQNALEEESENQKETLLNTQNRASPRGRKMRKSISQTDFQKNLELKQVNMEFSEEPKRREVYSQERNEDKSLSSNLDGELEDIYDIGRSSVKQKQRANHGTNIIREEDEEEDRELTQMKKNRITVHFRKKTGDTEKQGVFIFEEPEPASVPEKSDSIIDESFVGKEGADNEAEAKKEQNDINNSIEMTQNPQLNESKIRTITFNEFDNSFNRKRETIYNKGIKQKEKSFRKKIVHGWRKLRVWVKLKYHQSFVDVIVTTKNSREVDVNSQQAILIILPTSFIRKIWDSFMLLISFYTVILTPLFIAFDYDHQLYSILALEIITGIISLFDMYLNFQTGYINRRGVLEIYPSKIKKRYLKYFFIFDLLAALPICYYPRDYIYKLVYLYKFARISRLVRIMNRFSEFTDMHPGLLRIFKSLCFLVLLWHWIGCFYWYIAKSEGLSDDHSWGPPTILYPHETESFLLYSYCLFFAITVTTGVGLNLSPIRQVEVLFTMTTIIIGIFMYGLLLGSASSALMSMDEGDSDLRKQLDSLNNFMRKKKVTLELQNRIQENLKYLFSSHQSMHVNDQWFLNGVHPLLKLELTLQINKKYLEKVPMFQGVSFDCMIFLLSVLESRIFLPEEYVVYANQESDNMYFVQTGMLEVMDTMKGIRIRLFEGDFFGEQAIISQIHKRTASVKSMMYSELLILSRDGLRSVVEEYTDFGLKLFTYLKKKIINQLRRRKDYVSKWQLVSLLTRAARQIKRMNPKIKMMEMLFPEGLKDVKLPLARMGAKNLEKEEKRRSSSLDSNDVRGDMQVNNNKKHNIYQNTGQLSELVRNAKDKNIQIVQKELMGLGLDSPTNYDPKKGQRRNSLNKNYQTSSDYYDPYGKKEPEGKSAFDKYKTSIHDPGDKKGSKVFEKQLVKMGTYNQEGSTKTSFFKDDSKKLIKTGTVNLGEKETEMQKSRELKE